MQEANALFEDPQARIVAQDTVGGWLVSTVFLVLDHNYFGGRPLLFETLVADETMKTVLYMNRYHTESEAVEGHAETLAIVRANPKAAAVHLNELLSA